jgi:hypothetical protein
MLKDVRTGLTGTTTECLCKVLEAMKAATGPAAEGVGERIGIEAWLLRSGSELVISGPFLVIAENL